MRRSEQGSLSIETSLSMTIFMLAVLGLLILLKGIGVEDDIEQMLYDQSSQIAILDIQNTTELTAVVMAMTYVNGERKQISGNLKVTDVKLETDGTFSYTVKWERPFPLVGKTSKTLYSQNRLLTRGADGVRNSSSEVVYVTENGKKYHLAGCMHLFKSGNALSKDEAIQKGYTPCWHCVGGLKPFEKAPTAPSDK